MFANPLGSISSIQSLNRLGRLENTRNDLTEIFFWSVPLRAEESRVFCASHQGDDLVDRGVTYMSLATEMTESLPQAQILVLVQLSPQINVVWTYVSSDICPLKKEEEEERKMMLTVLSTEKL